MEIKPIPYQDTWPIRQEVMWPEKPIDYIKLPNDPQGLHYGLFVDHVLVSIVSAFVSAGEAQFRKFATLTREQGKGYGTLLLSHLLADLAARKVHKIWCNARVNKAAYYEQFGLRQTDSFFTKGEIRYVIMEMEV